MIGIDLVKESQQIASRAVKKNLYASYENMGKITQPRDGFVKISTPDDESFAINKAGVSVGATLQRFENYVTGVKEFILTNSRHVRRMLFDKENKSIGSIIFDIPGFPGERKMTYNVLVPGKDGKIMNLLEDGSQVLFQKGLHYDEHLGINAFGTMVKGVQGGYIPKYYGK